MNESAHDDDSSDSEDTLNNGIPGPPAHRDPPRLNMHWCCLEPIFSGGGGIAVLGTGLGGRGADKIRAAPLPRIKQYEDPDFSNQLRPVDYIRELKNNGLYEYVLGEDVDVLQYLQQDSIELQQQTCPRGLCNDCYRSFRWKVSCRACKNPICKEHDFGALKVRKCGYRDLHSERDHVRAHTEPPQLLVIPEFNPHRPSEDLERTPTASSQLDTVSTADNESESSEGTPMSQSQVLMPPAPEMSASSFAHSTTPDPFTLTSSLSFVPVSSSRPRSLSASGVRSRNSVSWSSPPRGLPPTSISNPLPLPCNPRHPVQWEGCGAYFCQYPRPVGDNRPQCPAMLKECAECLVLVCDSCSTANPPCPCTFCATNFHCPTCTRKPPVRAKCRLDAERKAKADAELRAQAKRERDRRERGRADELAGALCEFFACLAPGDGDVGEAAGEEDGEGEGVGEAGEAAAADNPLASPDSITVVTEFGVLEETGNVTVISAGGPYVSPPAADADTDPDADANAFAHYDDADAFTHYTAPEYDTADALDGPAVVMTEDTSQPPVPYWQGHGFSLQQHSAWGQMHDQMGLQQQQQQQSAWTQLQMHMHTQMAPQMGLHSQMGTHSQMGLHGHMGIGPHAQLHSYPPAPGFVPSYPVPGTALADGNVHPAAHGAHGETPSSIGTSIPSSTGMGMSTPTTPPPTTLASPPTTTAASSDVDLTADDADIDTDDVLDDDAGTGMLGSTAAEAGGALDAPAPAPSAASAAVSPMGS